MKNLAIYSILFFFVAHVQAQTLIATSLCPEATANHNQRKIVRDSLITKNTYVVFTDSLSQQTVIKGVVFNYAMQQWGNPANIILGRNPTLAISENGRIHLMYESNDSVRVIKHTSTADFISWTTPLTISDTLFSSRLPVADIDSAGKLNVFWIQHNDSLTESLIYACLQGDSLMLRKYITTKNAIEDIAIANHLLFYKNDLFFAVQFDQDSLQFFRSVDCMNHYDIIYTALGSQPCITYNSFWPGDPYMNPVRFLYIHLNSQLIEVASFQGYTNFFSDTLQAGPIDKICIDDLAPPLGYSYLFMQTGVLYHGFSYGTHWSTVLDTILGSPINPSIAYRSFNYHKVDFIWMENSGAGYNIYHKQAKKHVWLGIVDPEPGKGFLITGFPNPFTEQLTIHVSVDDGKTLPILQIYNSESQLVKVLSATSSSGYKYSYQWDGRNQTGDKVNSGVYIIMCSAGDERTARKVVYIAR